MNHHLLLLRPENQVSDITHLLMQRATAKGVKLTCSSKSMVTIHSYDDPNHSLAGILREQWDAGLMVSVNAANHFAQQARDWAPGMPMPVARWYAVGPTSAAAVANVVGRPVNCPWRQHNSEALLQLPELAKVKGQRWLIVRGKGGRDLAAETLTARGAQVTFLEVYQRKPTVVQPQEYQQWRDQVNGIVVTSAEQLGYFLAAVPNTDLDWLASCYWIVASDRLKQLLPSAMQQKVVVAHSATPFAIADAWQQLVEQHKDLL
ncbi:uroporphyrinogen-III synthase [Pseudidiomarina indica]|uniref:Uroporphyrinogen-III synthase n=1 Tax=Pseudidiomarina indica TaxID=1159017 RepID=A0A1G6D1Y3_9GAMM|nr:uroporphyrinogen-III synthase [Pseudidiomarina indica]SDB39176.1 uroporphyrinogen-III synthase [Pseudidiomarina indica]